MKKFYSVLFCLLFLSGTVMAAEETAAANSSQPATEQPTTADDVSQPVADSQQEDTLTAEQQQALEEMRSFLQSLNRQSGEIKLQGAPATLKVPESFYFLDSKDANRVLVDLWGNPPGGNTLGMIFPADQTPFDQDSWAVTIEYAKDGYVSDEGARDIDFAELLKAMQKGAKEESKERVKAGYEAIELVGWAATPFYDQATHKIHWAKELKFGQAAENTLNYNIRVLGREGVLELNFIAGMNQLKEIEANVNTVLAIAEFDPGHRYSDFNKSTDKVAEYGIDGLVGGSSIATVGLVAAAILILKKFGVYILIGLAALGSALFKRKKVSAES